MRTAPLANQSGGFVVPYSPEYRAGGTDENFLDALSKRTGGRLIHDPDQAFVHDLPAVEHPGRCGHTCWRWRPSSS